MAYLRCKECDRTFRQKSEDELIEKGVSHMRIDHSKKVSREKIKKRIKTGES